MKKFSIFISKTAVLDKISLQTAYTGAKKENDPGFYERVATIAKDYELLDSFWNETGGRMVEKLREFLSSSTLSDQGLRLDMELSGAYDDSLTPSLENDLFTAMGSGVLALWFKIVLPERSKEYFEMTDKALERVVCKVCHRRKPIRNNQ